MSQADEQTQLAYSKRVGQRSQSALIQQVENLRYVGDSEARWHDAVAEGLITPTRELPFVGVCLLEAGTPVEIKSAAVVYGKTSQRPGRFQLRESQHEKLVDAGAMYAFVVGDPSPDRELLAAKIVPAVAVTELVNSWIETADREPYAQFAWTRVFSDAAVNGGGQ